jgi:hypothetical protein
LVVAIVELRPEPVPSDAVANGPVTPLPLPLPQSKAVLARSGVRARFAVRGAMSV